MIIYQDSDPPPPISTNPTGTISMASSSDTHLPSISLSQAEQDRAALLEEDDLPPPYTPGPLADEGETSLEFGPVRPFQSRPAPSQITQNTGAGLVPPPRHPSAGLLGTITGSGSGRHSTGSMNPSDFMPGSFPSRSTSNASRYAPPSTPVPGRGYAPPTGLPPPSSSSSNTRYAPPSTPAPTDDARPTPAPTPGRPLLRNNHTLVYPHNHTCYKCHNTGYKNYDPSHPCRKCWERYGRVYEGPVVYAPWGQSGSGGRGGDTLQKPLPKFRAPSSNQYTSPPSLFPRSTSSLSSSYLPTSPSLPSSGLVHRPPPGSLVVKPGDPRIGGRLCWRCDGSGVVSFLIFDEERCPVCNGAGRVFY